LLEVNTTVEKIYKFYVIGRAVDQQSINFTSNTFVFDVRNDAWIQHPPFFLSEFQDHSILVNDSRSANYSLPEFDDDKGPQGVKVEVLGLN